MGQVGKNSILKLYFSGMWILNENSILRKFHFVKIEFLNLFDLSVVRFERSCNWVLLKLQPATPFSYYPGFLRPESDSFPFRFC